MLDSDKMLPILFQTAVCVFAESNSDTLVLYSAIRATISEFDHQVAYSYSDEVTTIYALVLNKLTKSSTFYNISLVRFS